MKNITLTILIFTISIHFSKSQSDTTSQLKVIDTIEIHHYNLRWRTTNGKTTYYKDDKKISKRKYNALAETTSKLKDCVPCYIIAYTNNKLAYEGDFYTDCGVGLFIEYYSNGIIKTKGEYKRNPNKDWEMESISEWCAIKNGTWENFDNKGNLIKSEKYINDVLSE
jgi:antitoxin component YwqK of YwqJK toxin-antitoxin module